MGRTHRRGGSTGPVDQVPLSPTDAPIRPAAISEIVAIRVLRGVIQLKAFATSQARMPVTPTAAVVAPTMHCAHMLCSLDPEMAARACALRDVYRAKLA